MLSYIPPPPAQVIELGPLSIHIYGALIALGAFAAALLTSRRYAALGGDSQLADRIIVWAIGMGVLGARAAYVVTHSGTLDHWYEAFFIWEGGLAFFGGLLAGAAAAIWILRRNSADVMTFAQAVAPAIPLAQAIGRWGNYFNQELYGSPTTLPWAVEIEPFHRVEGYGSFSTFHPTFLYESLFNFALFGFMLWLDRRRLLRRGALPFVYLAAYGAARFGLELIRTDTTFRLLGISRNGYVSLLAFGIGVAGLWWWQRRPSVPDGALPNQHQEPASK